MLDDYIRRVEANPRYTFDDFARDTGHSRVNNVVKWNQKRDAIFSEAADDSRKKLKCNRRSANTGGRDPVFSALYKGLHEEWEKRRCALCL